MSDTCQFCGAELRTGGTGQLTPLEEHVLDYNDPHRTLDRTPKTYFGPTDPVSTQGFKSGDWYVNTSEDSAFVLSSTSSPTWVRATPRSVSVAKLFDELAKYVTTMSLQSVLSSYVKSVDLASYVTETELANRSYVTSSQLASALSSYVTGSDLESFGFARTSDLSDYLKISSLHGYGFATRAYVDSVMSGLVSPGQLSAFVTDEILVQRLANYMTSDAVLTALSGYVPLSTLAAYTPTSGLAALITSTVSGMGYRTDAVYKTGTGVNRNIDTILSSWLRASASFSSSDDSHPPSCKAVSDQISSFSNDVAFIKRNASIRYHAVTSRNYDCSEVYVNSSQSSMKTYISLDREFVSPGFSYSGRRLLYVDVISAWNEVFKERRNGYNRPYVDVQHIQLEVHPSDKSGETAWVGYVGDYVITFNFGTDPTHTGPVPLGNVVVKTGLDSTTGQPLSNVVVADGSLSLSGVNWGDLLVVAVTEIADGRYAVSVKKFAGAAT